MANGPSNGVPRRLGLPAGPRAGRRGHRAGRDRPPEHLGPHRTPGAAHPERVTVAPRAAVGRVPASSARDRRHQGGTMSGRTRQVELGGRRGPRRTAPACAPPRASRWRSRWPCWPPASRPGSCRSAGSPTAVAAYVATPDAVPGANDWSCRPSAAHPEPVVLVHATGVNLGRTGWPSPRCSRTPATASSPSTTASPTCRSAASVAWARSPPRRATMATFVDRVLAATGASQVDVVGHSQGGMMPHYFIERLGGAAKVRTLIGLSPSNHGTTLGGLVTLGRQPQPARLRQLAALGRRAPRRRPAGGRVGLPARPLR